ncbi:9251_t:CDS:2 [Ambispora leptoticha]|uniref:9251_t:CDS:1 n=1 Tax=Ambispora leptoticha TaxID=144679 RepID=A0A9N9GD28_9GLOM|nr:9251_t:CDS:2 [Ambispora leptoticha]
MGNNYSHPNERKQKKSCSSNSSRPSSAHQFFINDPSPATGISKMDEDNKYFLPAIREEVDRLQSLHFLLHHIWQSNFSSAMEEKLQRGGAKVLDVGCGPGTWVLEMATNYPLSSFTGIDISATFPIEIKPQNATFIQANIFDGLTYPDSHFDFIYLRHLAVALTDEQWQKTVMIELVRILKPGGMIEIMESDVHWSKEGPILQNFMRIYIEDLGSRGIDLSTVKEIPELLRHNNRLVDFHQDMRQYSIGKWAGRVGELAADNAVQMFRILKCRYAATLRCSNDEYEILLSKLLNEIDEFQPHTNSYRFWATKIIL